MIRRTAAALLLLTAACASSAQAGVVQKLPKDGSWASYYVEMTAEMPANQGMSGTMTVRSVGSVKEDGEQCRWIEIEMKGTQKDGKKQNSIMKFLVREKDFKAGAKGSAKILRGWTKNNDDEAKELTEDEKKASGMVNLLLVAKAKNAKTIKKAKTIDYQKGQLKIATATTGSPEFELPEGAPADMKYNITQTVWSHKNIPFGMAAQVLQMEIKFKDNIAAKMTMNFTVQDYGANAKSVWPDKK